MIGNIQFCFIYIIFNLNNFVNEKWKNPKFKDNVIEDLDGIISHEIVHYIQGIKAKGKNPCKKYYKNKKSNPIELMADAKRISKYIFKYGTDFDKAFYEYINSEKARHYNQLIEYISEEFPSKTRKIKNRLLKYIRLYYDQYKNHY